MEKTLEEKAKTPIIITPLGNNLRDYIIERGTELYNSYKRNRVARNVKTLLKNAREKPEKWEEIKRQRSTLKRDFRDAQVPREKLKQYVLPKIMGLNTEEKSRLGKISTTAGILIGTPYFRERVYGLLYPTIKFLTPQIIWGMPLLNEGIGSPISKAIGNLTNQPTEAFYWGGLIISAYLGLHLGNRASNHGINPNYPEEYHIKKAAEANRRLTSSKNPTSCYEPYFQGDPLNRLWLN